MRWPIDRRAQHHLMALQLPVLFVMVPVIVRTLRLGLPPLELAIAYALALMGWILVGSGLVRPAARTAVAGMATLLFTLEAFLCMFEWRAAFTPSLSFILDSLTAAIPTAYAILGGTKLLVVVVLLTIITVWSFLAFRAVLRHFPTATHPTQRIARITIGILLILTYSRSVQSIVTAYQYNAARSEISVLLRSPSPFVTAGDDNVFILQLESGNALIAGGYMLPASSRESFLERTLPVLASLRKRGVYFPLFWGNAIMTNRAQEAILCGIAMNLGQAFSFHSKDLPATCLPRILRAAGYRTIAYRSDDLRFSNEGVFLSATGFGEVHQEDIMHADDQKTSWGYDDCTFFRRSFEHLKATSPDRKKLFVYTEVSAHHYPFGENGTDFRERYLASLTAQDACIQTFIEEFDAFAPERSHLFILPDHSWPTGVNGSTINSLGAWPENFLISLLYLPPRSDPQYMTSQVVNQRFSQTALMGTVLDLLAHTISPDSFAPLLRAGQPFPQTITDCTVLTQPYDNGNIVTVHGDRYYRYGVIDRTVQFVDLARDLFGTDPVTIARALDFRTFWSTFGCPTPSRAS